MPMNGGPTPGGGGHPRHNGASDPLNDHPRYNGQDPTVARYRGNNNDDLIMKDKTPWMHHSYYIPPPLTEVSWTASGPVRPALHFRTFTYRKESGAFNSDTVGMHTMLPPVSISKAPRKPDQMRGTRQGRLTTAIYRGQSYSQTTQVQGQ